MASANAQATAGSEALRTITINTADIFKALPVTIVPPGQTVVQRCSIPLIQAQISQNIDFKIKEIHPRVEATVPMPQAKPPAPTCAPVTK